MLRYFGAPMALRTQIIVIAHHALEAMPRKVRGTTPVTDIPEVPPAFLDQMAYCASYMLVALLERATDTEAGHAKHLKQFFDVRKLDTALHTLPSLCLPHHEG